MPALNAVPIQQRPLRQRLRLYWRDFRVLLRAFSRPLLIFFGMIVVFGLAYWQLSLLAGVSDPPSAAEALFLVVGMIFFQASSPFPDVWYLQLFFFVMPIIGLAWLSAGAANLGVKLFNRSARGQEWEAALASTFSDHVIVCGTGKLGYRVVLQLLKFGESVVAIEQDTGKPFVSLVQQYDVPVIVGDARRPEVLRRAGLERAAAIVCCTQDDLTNLDIALDAREANPNIKVVLRMFDGDLAAKIERGFGIHTAFSASALAAPAFAAAATRAHIEYSFYVGDTLLHVSQLTVAADSPLVNRLMEDAERTFNMTVIMHHTGTHMHLHPKHDEVIHAGDTLVVFATLDALGEIGAMTPPRPDQPLYASQSVIKRLFKRRE